jgi:hypothetical protein
MYVMQQKPKKHHYVPKLHLRQFYDDANQLWIYDRQTNNYRHSSSAGIGYLPDYYTVDTVDEKDSTEIEVMLGIVESVAGPLLLKLANQESIPSVERGDIAIFLALQAVRVPNLEKTVIEGTKKSYQAVLKEYLRILATNEAAFNSMKRKMEADGVRHNFSQDDLREELAKGYEPSLEMDVPRGYTVKMALDMVNKELAHGFNVLDWHVLEAPKGSAFVTSDNPFVNLGRGFLMPNTFKIFPLAKNKALLIGHRQNASLAYQKVDAKLVRRLNKDITQHSDRYVFSHSKALLERMVKLTKIDTVKKGARAEVNVYHGPNDPEGLVVLSNTGN